MKSGFIILIALLVNISGVFGQQWIKNMPGYEQYRKVAPQIRGSVKSGRLMVVWSEDGKSFDFNRDGKKYTYTISTGKTTEQGEAKTEDFSMMRFRRPAGAPDRGRQYTFADSPDKKWKAIYRDGNVNIIDQETKGEISVTSDGSEIRRVKYGSATWVYGEELNQSTAMWWSPGSEKLAFYRFDYRKVKDYYLQYKQTMQYDSLEIEPYTKVGALNPEVGLLIYDLKSKKTVEVDVREGKAFNNQLVGHYIYGIAWSPDGKELIFHRTNRKQDIMELTAADPESGKCRVIVREEWPASFVQNSPEMKYLSDNQRFIWESERSGYKNYYIYHLQKGLIGQLTNHSFEVAGIVKVDEKAGMFYYYARSGDNHMKMQLHRCKLDGTADVCLTDPSFHHTVSVSPDGKYLVDISETHNTPPVTRLLNNKGKVISTLADSDLTKFNELGLKKLEAFTFTSADGFTQLHGLLHFPSGFDPGKKYPVLLANYGGPETNEFRETFATPNSLTEFGFIVANIDGRNAGGKGKKLIDKLYGNLCIIEIDDFAEGIKSLHNRPYIDKNRVGVYGTSYGGTTAAACILRYPDLFHAAVANSGVMNWKNYDNIYTERYMNLIENNKAGYDAANLMTYAKNLKGKLMIFYGTNDNNVHPANSLQLIQALQREGKSFEVQVGPDMGHMAVNTERMMEFFIQNLVLMK